MTLTQLLRTCSWQELRHHPWRHSAAVLAVTLGVALAAAGGAAPWLPGPGAIAPILPWRNDWLLKFSTLLIRFFRGRPEAVTGEAANR